MRVPWRLVRTDEALESLQCALAEAWEDGRAAAFYDMKARLNSFGKDKPADSENPFQCPD